jgi:hypothetical protein
MTLDEEKLSVQLKEQDCPRRDQFEQNYYYYVYVNTL